jgi:hypothetical protein
MLDRRVDRKDVTGQGEKHSQLEESKGPVRIVDDHVKLLRREKRSLRAKLGQVISVDKDPVSRLGRRKGKVRMVRVPRVKDPCASIGKGFSRDHSLKEERQW